MDEKEIKDIREFVKRNLRDMTRSHISMEQRVDNPDNVLEDEGFLKGIKLYDMHHYQYKSFKLEIEDYKCITVLRLIPTADYDMEILIVFAEGKAYMYSTRYKVESIALTYIFYLLKMLVSRNDTRSISFFSGKLESFISEDKNVMNYIRYHDTVKSIEDEYTELLDRMKREQAIHCMRSAYEKVKEAYRLLEETEFDNDIPGEIAEALQTYVSENNYF